MLKSAIYGFIVADALGVPYEFKKRGSFQCTDMVGHGTWNQPLGTWSDDSSMMLATLDSIKQCGAINVEDMRARFKRWAFEAEYTANGDTFDIGATTREALYSGHGLDHYYANGNGSLMRILPLAFFDCTYQEIAEVSAITHAHQISVTACQIYVDIARRLISGKSISEILPELISYRDKGFERLATIHQLEEASIKSSGYVIDTLEAALWCLSKANSYREAVLKAVNLGEDTDTVAAVTGGLAGIQYGYDAIPKDWIDNVRNKKLIQSILE